MQSDAEQQQGDADIGQFADDMRVGERRPG